MMAIRTVTISFLFALVPCRVCSQEAKVLFPQSEWSVGTPGGGQFLSVMGIAAMEDGFLMVSDKLSNALIQLSNNGQIKGRLQKRGSLPGTFNGPGPVACWRKLVAVADFASNRIQLIGSDLNPVGEFHTAGSIFTMAFDEEGHLWVGALRGESGEILFKYSQQGRELFSRKPQVAANTVFDAIFRLVCTGGRVCLVYSTRNVIERWDTAGKPLGTFAVSGFPLVARSSSDGAKAKHDGSAAPDILFVDCTLDGAGRIVLLAGDVGKRPRREVFSINDNGEIVSLFCLPEQASAIRFITGSKVVAVEKRKTVISCYTLQAEE
jgi:hypothetical protein